MDLPSLAALAPCDVGVKSGVAKHNSTKKTVLQTVVQKVRAKFSFDCEKAQDDLEKASHAYSEAYREEKSLMERAIASKYEEEKEPAMKAAMQASVVARDKAKEYVKEFDRIARDAPPKEKCLHPYFKTLYRILKRDYDLGDAAADSSDEEDEEDEDDDDDDL